MKESDNRKIGVVSLLTDHRILYRSNDGITLLSHCATFRVRRDHTGENEVVMKLPKEKEVPLLSFGTTHMGRRVKAARDVRLEVVKPTDVTLLTEQRSPEPDVRYFRFHSRGKKKVHTEACFWIIGPDN